ncbi:MAG: helix-turn-helix domain-containing protein [Lachnospiraceae bacterium]|nr:helix-turn-helix domain-containing protein [Lachnospiraceae bacterium]
MGNQSADSELTFLKTKDLMTIFGFGRDKAYALKHSKSFPSIRIGKTYVVTEKNLREWLDGENRKRRK